MAALGLKSGDEVVVPALTMASTSFGVLHNGSIPVFADSDLDTFEISAESIEKVITPKTKAVMTVSLLAWLQTMIRFWIYVNVIICILLKIMRNVI